MRKGSKQSPEALEKMRAAVRAWWADPQKRASRTGHRLTPEHREAMRQAKLRNPVRYWLGKSRPSPSSETRAKMSAASKRNTLPANWGLCRPPKGVPRDPAITAKMTATMRTPEMRARMAAHTLGKPCRHSKHPVYYKGIRMRSAYEVRVASALDALGVKWKYEWKRFSFRGFTYCPDFYLPADRAFWEVKGWYGPNSRRAVETFRREHPEIPLVLINRECIEALEAAVRKAA